ncbi:hypothetical protein BDP55DRAFT_729457 [Colletotrichum godetiae]|uniref:Infection structure specific protein n=1 Tax=Colletotrichum godetiae TaxID=1209918 RepID=A0AAJ0EX31_9PEZI|nr:uncharacterized protein BDP55DRAFT_729457 [Colletotrichum godetiae]KAK1674814.1 hypothetical protein BDP55DRAFT_729457 [Colletotrichum godetiae]
MKTSSLLSAVSAMLALAIAQTTATSTSSERAPRVTSSARPFFIYDTHPTGSLEASVVAYERSMATYQVVCPTADAACEKEGYWPANVTHIEGSSWVGSNTATSGIVKYWDCRLGSGGGDVLSDQYGRCHVSTSTPSLSTGTMDEELPVNTCFVEARSVVVAITAGLDKVEAVHRILTESEYVGAWEATALMSILSSQWATGTCSPLTSPAPYTGSLITGRPSSSLPAETGAAAGTATGTGTGSATGAASGTAAGTSTGAASGAAAGVASNLLLLLGSAFVGCVTLW